ncbi:MAG: hypothetical protein H2057_04350 [Alphaproteobacteria bacterium]|nr:hypothetical protein [Alphaproteobacteria bacterium]
MTPSRSHSLLIPLRSFHTLLVSLSTQDMARCDAWQGLVIISGRPPGAHLTIVSQAGHASMEPETVKAMVAAGNDLKNSLLKRVPRSKNAL